jgi:DNA-binding beta-propeller fold protein YncE
MRNLTFLLFLTLFFQSVFAQKPLKITTLQVPGKQEYSKIDVNGHSVLCSGRYVTPAGKTIQITRAPFGLNITPDGKKALVLHHTGVITIIDTQNPDNFTRIPSYDHKIPSVLEGATFLGIAFSQDSKIAYLSGGDKGNVVLMDMKNFKKMDEISLNGKINQETFEDSFTSDLTIDYSKNELFVLDRGNFRVVRINLITKQITASIKVGRIPFGIALSPDKKTLFVANVGLYEYPAVPGVTPANKDTMMLDFPPYGIPSPEAEKGIEINGRKIPGLGSPLVPEAMSVWTIDLATNQVMDKFKTGLQIGQMIEESEIIGGSSPNSIAVGKQYAYISNAHNDLITVIDYKKRKIIREFPIKIDKRIDKYRGLMPFGLTLSQDEKTLYIALLGFNAVAVIDPKTYQTKGLIPTGWGTTRVALSPDNQQLYITSARGYGAGPNGGKDFVKPIQGTYIGDIQLGTFQSLSLTSPPASEGGAKNKNSPFGGWQALTQQVIDNTFREVAIEDDGKNPLPPLPKIRQHTLSTGVGLPIKHIVYITKENRTYDEVFGQLKNGKGDSTLARFGVNCEYTLPDSMQAFAKGLKVMPNHHKIAQQFAFSDNFYCDSDASIHGHHWMVGTIPNEYVEANSASNAAFNTFSKAPGRRFPKSTGAIDPEDYNEKGGLWENMGRNNISFYNFGEVNEFAGVWEEWNHTKFGAMQPVIFPLPKVLFDNTSRNYAGYNTNIPDQYRMEQFEEEFTQKWLSGKDTMPSLLVMQVPNDHGATPRPADGYPYPHSYMADNDLAIGRILHFLSRTKYWKNTLVIITEDDPQGGVDHIDAHRSVLLMAGPYVKKGYVSHTHANFGSILKVIYNILGADYVNHYDLTASLLQDFFTDKPDFMPYTLEMSDLRIFDPQKAMNRYNKTIDWRKIQQGPKMDNENEQRKEHYKNDHK